MRSKNKMMKFTDARKCEAWRCSKFICTNYSSSDPDCRNGMCRHCRCGRLCSYCRNAKNCKAAVSNLGITFTGYFVNEKTIGCPKSPTLITILPSRVSFFCTSMNASLNRVLPHNVITGYFPVIFFSLNQNIPFCFLPVYRNSQVV